jgi:hypothetical protein
MTIAVTEEHERRLWEELNSLLVDAVPDGATKARAEDAILLAIMGHDAEIYVLYEQVRMLARETPGYLRDKLEEDNPVARGQRRRYGKWA